MSSDRQDWETPQAFFDTWDAVYYFTLDAAATAENAKCENYITPEMDALVTPWDAGGDGAIWLNPPYGKLQSAFVTRAWSESQRTGRIVACLIPARTDTRLWHDVIFPAERSGRAEIIYIRGRLKFVGAADSATFPSALVVFRRDPL
jgi:site-specific DNA-methyltransferase (adenine-specific)